MLIKSIKRPLLFINMIVIGIVIVAVNAYYSTLSFPQMKMTEGIIKGKVTDVEDKGTYLDVTVKNIEIVETESKEPVAFLNDNKLLTKGMAKCSITNKSTELRIGQNVTIKGKFGFYDTKTNPGQFDTRKYSLSKGIVIKGSSCEAVEYDQKRDYVKEAMRTIREYCLELLDNSLSKEDAALMKAILLADKSDIDEETKENYQNAGVSHILAISGLHITLFGAGILFVLRFLPIPMPVSYGIAIAILFLYGLMIGFSPSAFRAIIMFGILCMGRVRLRSYDTLTAMSAAAVITLLFRPYSCLQTGFLLSYSAIGGLAVGVPAFSFISERKKAIKESIKSCTAVTLFTLPTVINSYYKVPLYAPFINILIVPGMTFVLIAGMACMVWEAIFPKIFNVFSVGIHLIFRLYEILIKASLCLPFSSIVLGERNIAKCLLYLLFLTIICSLSAKFGTEIYRRKKVLNNKKRRYPNYNVSGAMKDNTKKERLRKILTALFICADVLFLAFSLKKDMITFLDVGQGLCVVMNVSGQTYCFDGGSSDKREVWKYVIKPYLKSQGKETVDMWFVSHADNDHISGVKDALSDDEITVKRLCISDYRNEKVDELVCVAKENKTEVYIAYKGQKIKSKNIEFEILAPKKGGYDSKEMNENSLVVLAKTKAGNVLFMGDAGENAEKDILKENCEANVYQVAHHGSAQGANSDYFIEKIHPLASVISCGFANSYGHPHKETLESLERTASSVFRTDCDGAVTIVLGERMVIYPFLKNKQ